jgi:hypothetical protein
MREKETSPFFILLFFFFCMIMILEQAALEHHRTTERIFRSKKKIQNDEGAKQHIALSTSQAAWTFVAMCDGGLIPSRHKEGHVRQLSNWDA